MSPPLIDPRTPNSLMISKCSRYTNDIVKSILHIATFRLLLFMYDFNLSRNRNGNLRHLLNDVGDEVGDGIHIGIEEDEHHNRRRFFKCCEGAPIILFSDKLVVLCLGEEFTT